MFCLQSKPYTYVSSTVDAGLQQSYHLWKAKQLIADVLKVQLRQKAVSEALSRRIAPLAGTEQSRNLHFIRNVRQRSQFVELKLKNLTFKRDKILNGISPSLYFLQITIGSWMTRTDSQHPAESDLLWNYDAPVVGHITLNDIQLSELVIELFDEQVIDDDAASVAFGSSMIDKILGCNCGNFISISMDIFGRKNKKLGTIQFEVCADMVNDHFFVSSDPNGLERLEINFIDSEDRDIKVTKLDDSIKEGNRYAYTNFSSLGRLVGLFRGDGIQGIHPSIENKIVDESNILDIPLEEIVKVIFVIVL